jgi:RNA polymerase sigma factor (sigma-70 family)
VKGPVMLSDQLLVSQCQAGNQEAFSEIVSRYQNLVCSIAYGVTGNLHSSEELAQDAFITAWRSMDSVRDAARLRAWLCGIVRNLANNTARRLQHDVLSEAGKIEIAADEPERNDHNPAEILIVREELELVDSALSTLPVTYREPLILYYRQQQSVANVADSLELSHDAVKQRLARGRELLRQEIATIVERGLRQSSPGRAFTLAVVAALPEISGSAKAATITVVAAKGAGATQAAGWIGSIGAVFGPLAGLLGAWFGYSMSLKSARSDRERAFIRTIARWSLTGMLVFGGAITLLLANANRLTASSPFTFAGILALLTVGYIVGLLWIIVYANRHAAKIRDDYVIQGILLDDVTATMPKQIQQFQKRRVYQSRIRFLGLPLISVRFNGARKGDDPHRLQAAVGWIAVGDKAYGVLFACGSISVGGIAVGAISVGVISFGGFAVGALPVGGAALGIWALGGMAIGSLAFGGIAIAWNVASGGVAIAHYAAMGGIAVAANSNGEIAQSIVAEHIFFRTGQLLLTPWSWWGMVALMLLPMWIATKLVGPSGEKDK